MKIKKGSLKTISGNDDVEREFSSQRSALNSDDKDATIARLWTQNNIKDKRIRDLEKKL